jgi:hypothetical protein
VKAIETRYNGRSFRTRGEARFAVLFDVCQLRSIYEPEGFWPDDGQRYLPDFWLPGLDYYFKVKSELPKREAIYKCYALADETGKRVAMAHGSPGLETLVDCFYPGSSKRFITTVPAFFMQWLHSDVVLAAIEAAQSARFEFGETPKVIPFPAAPKTQAEATLF